MAEIFMMIGVAFIVTGFGIIQIVFLRWIHRQFGLWVWVVALCTLSGIDCMMLGTCFL